MKLHYSELRSLDSAIEHLQAIVNGLRAGLLRLEHGNEQLLLRPGAVLDFAVSASRKGVNERFELTLEWRRQDLTILGSGDDLFERSSLDLEPPVSSDDDDTLAEEPETPEDEAVTVRQSSPPHGQPRRAFDTDAERFQRLYQEARTSPGEDRPRLDEARFSASLEVAGVEPELRRELLTVARHADQEGRDRLFTARSISELIATTLAGTA